MVKIRGLLAVTLSLVAASIAFALTRQIVARAFVESAETESAPPTKVRIGFAG